MDKCGWKKKKSNEACWAQRDHLSNGNPLWCRRLWEYPGKLSHWFWPFILEEYSAIQKSGQDGLFPFIPIISLRYVLTQILTWFKVISPIPHQLQVRNFMSIHGFLVALMWEFWTFLLPVLMLFLKENEINAEWKDPVL